MGKPKSKKVIPAAPAQKPDAIAVIKSTETKLPNGFVKVEVEGKVGDGIPRKGFEKKFPEPGSKKVDLPGYDRYHIAGPDATGVEEGIVYAPRNFNIGKTAEIENLIRNAHEQAKLVGGEVYVTIKVIAKEWKEVDGVTIRVLKEIEWTIEVRLPGSDKLIPLVSQERYFLKEPPTAPKLWSGYVPEAVQGVAAVAVPIIIQEFIHKPAVEKRIMDKTKERGYVSYNAPSEQGLLYDLGAWLLDPFRDAEFSVGMDKRFDVTIWRNHLKKATGAKKPGESFEIEWDVGTCQKDFINPERKVIEQRRIVYRKQPDGSWAVVSGDAKGTPDLNTIISDSVSDSEVQAILFSDYCKA